jgi:putative adenylate-forming enzyme
MKFKLLILYYWLEFQWSRWFYRGRPGLERLQQKRLKALFRHLRKAPFYQALVARKARLQEFPVIDKAVMMREFNQINTVGIDKNEALQLALAAEENRDFSPMIKGITVGLSSGTSGNKGLFLASEKERARWVAGVLDRVIGFQLRRRKVAFFLRANSKLYESARSQLLQFQFFDILRPMEQLLVELGEFQPQVIVAQPSVLREIAKAVEAGRFSLSMEKVVSVAEVLDPQDRQYFERIFGLQIQEVYQCTEGFLAASCEQGRLHFNEDFIIIEKKTVDDTGHRFHPIITDLYRRSQPIVRYELNDVIVSRESCECGSDKLAIEMIEGRADDVLTLPGKSGIVRVFPDFVRRTIISASDAISFYHLNQVGKQDLNCYLEFFSEEVSVPLEQEKVRKKLEDLFAKLEIKPVNIHFTTTYTHDRGNKVIRIRNEYQTSR